MTFARRLLAGGGGSFVVPPTGPPILGVEVVATTVLVTGAIDGKDWHGRAAMKTLASGVIVLTYRSGTAHNVNDGALHIKFSDDGGATWTAPDTKLGGGAVTGFPMNPSTLTAGEDAGEPWLYYFPDTDRLVLHMWRSDYFVTSNGTWQSESEDGGETWTTSHGPIEFEDPTASAATHRRTYATDDDFIDPDTGDLYAGARIYTNFSFNTSNFCLMRSTDQGVTWERVSVMVAASEAGGRGSYEAGIEYLGDGRIIAMIRDGFATHSYRRFSDDMGETWGTLTDMNATVGIAGRQRVYTVDHLQGNANWWEDERLIMVGYVHVNSGSGSPRRNAVWLSSDAGLTWSTPFYVDAAYTDAGYGDIRYDPSSGLYRYVQYRGTSLNVADLVQYDLSIVV